MSKVAPTCQATLKKKKGDDARCPNKATCGPFCGHHRHLCIAVVGGARKGRACACRATHGRYCGRHKALSERTCAAFQQDGIKCSCKSTHGKFCGKHAKKKKNKKKTATKARS